MRLRKECIGKKIYLGKTKIVFTVTEKDQDILLKFGHTNLFENDNTIIESGNEGHNIDLKRVKKRKRTE
jgi:hypothetical protein